MRNVDKKWLWLAIGTVLQITGLIMFGQGFFPMKIPLSGLSTEEYSEQLIPIHYDRFVFIMIDALRSDFVYSPLGQQNMKFLHELIATKHALPLIGKAQAPTVTLPRIKALLTGSLPSFTDFVWNLNSPQLHEDSLVHQLAAHNWTLSFYGDDTWLRLFPPESFFQSWEGTNSFFVADTIEVDNNVTRSYKKDIENQKNEGKQGMILHYLGLDHIGHLQGPTSKLIPHKLQEMDQIIQDVYQHYQSEDLTRCYEKADDSTSNSHLESMKRIDKCGSMIIISGDHGMNELGNHGGSTDSEINTALLFLDPTRSFTSTFTSENENEVHTHSITQQDSLHVESVSQIDFTSSFSLLFGLPIPRNNLGRLIRPILSNLLTPRQLLRAYQINTRQLIIVLQANPSLWHLEQPLTPLMHDIWNEYVKLQLLLSSFEQSNNTQTFSDTTNDVSIILHRFEMLQEKICTSFVESLTTYHMEYLLIGIFLLLASSICFIILFSLVATTYTNSVNFWQCCLILTRFSFIQYLEVVFLIIGNILFFASLFTSSLVEEEHQTWYFVVISIFTIYFVVVLLEEELPKPTTPSDKWGKYQILFLLLLIGLMHRVLRSWNQTGDKYLYQWDYGDFFESSIFSLIPSIILAGFFLVKFPFQLTREGDPFWRFCWAVCLRYMKFSAIFCCCVNFLLKLQQMDLIEVFGLILPEQQMTHLIRLALGLLLGQFLMGVCSVYIRKYSLNDFGGGPLAVPMVLLMMLLHKPRNQFLILLLILQYKFIKTFFKAFAELPSVRSHYYTDFFHVFRMSVVWLWLAKASFFMFGNSNNLASIDISGAYIGLESYNALIVGVFALLILYTGPIITAWSFARSVHTIVIIKLPSLLMAIIWSGLHSILLTCFCAVITILRYHLFIWSVFCPKFLFEVMHTSFFVTFSLLLCIFANVLVK